MFKASSSGERHNSQSVLSALQDWSRQQLHSTCVCNISTSLELGELPKYLLTTISLIALLTKHKNNLLYNIPQRRREVGRRGTSDWSRSDIWRIDTTLNDVPNGGSLIAMVERMVGDKMEK